MKTAEEFLKNFNEEENNIDKLYYDSYVKKAMIKFAKMHVQEALRLANEKAELQDIDRPEDFFEYDGVNGFSKILNKNVISYEGYYHVCIDSDSVLNAYPLDLIK